MKMPVKLHFFTDDRFAFDGNVTGGIDRVSGHVHVLGHEPVLLELVCKTLNVASDKKAVRSVDAPAFHITHHLPVGRRFRKNIW
jgi:hypothetical protein